MHDKELVGYIEKELQKGFHHNEIRRALLAVGHDAQVVEDSLLHVHNNLERKMKVKKALSILIPILLVLLIIVAVYVMKQPSSTDNPPISDNITKQQNNEKIENGKIENPVDAFYFTCVTLTTLGFGDIAPVTYGGRLLVSIEVLIGIVIISIFLTAVAQKFMRTR